MHLMQFAVGMADEDGGVDDPFSKATIQLVVDRYRIRRIRLPLHRRNDTAFDPVVDDPKADNNRAPFDPATPTAQAQHGWTHVRRPRKHLHRIQSCACHRIGVIAMARSPGLPRIMADHRSFLMAVERLHRRIDVPESKARTGAVPPSGRDEPPVRCVKIEPLPLSLLHTSRTCVTLTKREVK
jgi:hypothetical protein